MNIIRIIEEYESFVKLSFDIFKTKFSIDEPPLVAHRKGIIPKTGTLLYAEYKLDYIFHGMGCFCVYNNSIEINFDYRLKWFDYKGFEAGNLFLFIQSVERYKNIINKEQLVFMLDDLVKEGLLKINPDEIKIDGYNFYLSL